MARPGKFKKLTKPELKRYEQYMTDGVSEENYESFHELETKFNNYNKPPELSEGAKAHLVERYSFEKYDTKRASVSSKGKPAQVKGYVLQPEAYELIRKVDKIDYTTPLGSIENEFLSGIPDLVSPDSSKIIEIKTAWSTDTFFPHLYKKLPPIVWYQVQGYLDIYNCDLAEVCYVLLNTPPHLVEQEKAENFRKYTFGEITRERYEYVETRNAIQFDYNKIPNKKRIIRFEVRRHEPTISLIHNKVELSREWLAEFDKTHMGNKKIIVLPEQYINGNAIGIEEDNT